MPDNPSEFDYPEGFALVRMDDGSARVIIEHPTNKGTYFGTGFDPWQLRRLGTEATKMAAELLDGTPEDRHPCSHPAEGAARRIMRDIEDGHLSLIWHRDGSISGDRQFSVPGANYAIFWGWLQQGRVIANGHPGRYPLVPVKGWPKGASRG